MFRPNFSASNMGSDISDWVLTAVKECGCCSWLAALKIERWLCSAVMIVAAYDGLRCSFLTIVAIVNPGSM